MNGTLRAALAVGTLSAALLAGCSSRPNTAAATNTAIAVPATGCHAQLAAWKASGGLDDLQGVMVSEETVGQDLTLLDSAASSGGSLTSAEASLRTDSAAFLAAARKADGHLPPACDKTLKTAANSALTGWSAANTDAANALLAADQGDSAGVAKQADAGSAHEQDAAGQYRKTMAELKAKRIA